MDSFEEESSRLATYDLWPLESPVQPLDLAQAGFFYTGIADRVQCAFCYGLHGDWKTGDIPMMEHQRLFPSCKFVKILSRNNTEDGSRSSQNTRTQGGGEDPMYHADITSRISSFRNWPGNNIPQGPTELASAGFFYMGDGDCVRCFSCGLGLRNWEEDEDPWVEHARWMPSCAYINSSPAGHCYHRAITGAYSPNVLPNDRPVDGHLPISLACSEEALFPKYQSLDQRRKSFQPLQMVAVKPKRHAVAGYFHDPATFTIRCFWCGMILNPMNWNDENLFAVHEKESPHCQYMINLPHVCPEFGLELEQDLPRDEILQLLLLVTDR